MKVKTKKGIVEVAKSFNELSTALKEVGSASNGTAKTIGEFNRSSYIRWECNFKPQSQRVINIVLITGLILALAEIVWYVVTKL